MAQSNQVIAYNFFSQGYGISSSYSPGLTSSSGRETSNLTGLNSSNGTIGSDVIAPSAAVTSLSSLRGNIPSHFVDEGQKRCIDLENRYCMIILSLLLVFAYIKYVYMLLISSPFQAKRLPILLTRIRQLLGIPHHQQ